jgi:hypothetical protein
MATKGPAFESLMSEGKIPEKSAMEKLAMKNLLLRAETNNAVESIKTLNQIYIDSLKIPNMIDYIIKIAKLYGIGMFVINKFLSFINLDNSFVIDDDVLVELGALNSQRRNLTIMRQFLKRRYLVEGIDYEERTVINENNHKTIKYYFNGGGVIKCCLTMKFSKPNLCKYSILINAVRLYYVLVNKINIKLETQLFVKSERNKIEALSRIYCKNILNANFNSEIYYYYVFFVKEEYFHDKMILKYKFGSTFNICDAYYKYRIEYGECVKLIFLCKYGKVEILDSIFKCYLRGKGILNKHNTFTTSAKYPIEKIIEQLGVMCSMWKKA